MKLTAGKVLVWGAVVAAVAGIAVAVKPAPQIVESATVGRGDLQVSVQEDGRTRIRERYVVSAPLAGRLLRVSLKAGDRVEAGKTLLAVIEPGDPELLDARALALAEARVKAAEAAHEQGAAQLMRVEAEYQQAEAEMKRRQELLQNKAISREEAETSITRERALFAEYKSAQFAVQVRAFELEQARAALLSTKPGNGSGGTLRFDIFSPIDGRVLRVLQESSTIIQSGAPIVELGDPADLEIEVDVLSRDAVNIQNGAKVYLEHWGGETELEARVRLVEPAAFTKISALGVEEQRVWVIADFVDPADKRPPLGDGYRVQARIVTWENADALIVPSGALFRNGGAWAAYVIEEGRAVTREVKVGRDNGLAAEVLGGVEAGEVVILYPGDRIQDGAAVATREGK